LSTFSTPTPTSSRGAPQICQASRGRSPSTPLISYLTPEPCNNGYGTLTKSDAERAIGVELRKLLEVGFIKEVFHPTWLANHVLVKKKNGKWQMCVDYTSLNKASPKVPFPLPRIDQIVDSTVGCELLCLLDAYSGYHQINMKESD
jgi:hypothetical protein